MNAKEELIKHVGDKKVKWVYVGYTPSWDEGVKIEGKLEDVLPLMDFEYDNWYGRQFICGTIWYEDGSWAEREEYDGSEWWSDKVCPPLPDSYKEVEDIKVAGSSYPCGPCSLPVKCSSCGTIITPENVVEDECTDDCETCHYCGIGKCPNCGAHWHCGGCI